MSDIIHSILNDDKARYLFYLWVGCAALAGAGHTAWVSLRTKRNKMTLGYLGRFAYPIRIACMSLVSFASALVALFLVVGSMALAAAAFVVAYDTSNGVLARAVLESRQQDDSTAYAESPPIAVPESMPAIRYVEWPHSDKFYVPLEALSKIKQ